MKFVDLKEVPGEVSIIDDLAKMLRQCARGQALQVGRDELPKGYGLGSMLKKLAGRLPFKFRINKKNDTVLYFIREGGRPYNYQLAGEGDGVVTKTGHKHVEVAGGVVQAARGRYMGDLQALIKKHGELTLRASSFKTPAAYYATVRVLGRSGFGCPSSTKGIGAQITVSAPNFQRKGAGNEAPRTHGISVTNGNKFTDNQESHNKIAALIAANQGRAAIEKSSFKTKSAMYNCSYQFKKMGYTTEPEGTCIVFIAKDWKDTTLRVASGQHKKAGASGGFGFVQMREMLKDADSCTVDKSRFTSKDCRWVFVAKARKLGYKVEGSAKDSKALTITKPSV